MNNKVNYILKTKESKKMSKKNDKTIHEFDFDLICEYFLLINRQGPGSSEVTKKALSFIDNLNDNSKIADIGCGTGGQTITLAQEIKGHITAMDLFPKFIDKLNENAKKFNLENRITGIVGSMDNLPFEENELDLIWSEGAIYNIGFQKGLTEWKKYLKKGGYIAVSEATWFTEERPKEIEDFWYPAYPEIDTTYNKLAQMQKAGYMPIATFALPEESWTKHFFEPQKLSQEIFLERHKGNLAAEEFVKLAKDEKRLYDLYKDYYGYVFYIGKKL